MRPGKHSAGCSSASSRWQPSPKAGRRPHEGRRRGHARCALRIRRHGRPALLLLHRPAARGAGARLLRLVRRQRDLSEGRGPPRPPPRGSRSTGSWPRRTPVPRAAAGPRPAERARERRSHPRRSRRGARGRGCRARAGDRGERDRRLPPAESAASESRRAEELGQHFLVDENILGVIGRLAALEADRRRARDRPRARGAHAVPGGARRARPRRRDRPVARSAPAQLENVSDRSR